MLKLPLEPGVAAKFLLLASMRANAKVPAKKQFPVHGVADAAVATLKKTFLASLPTEWDNAHVEQWAARLRESLIPVLHRVVLASGHVHAMKFKAPRALGEGDGHAFHGNQYTEGDTTAYHGTATARLNQILKEGLKASHAGETSLFSSQGTVYATTSREEAEQWGIDHTPWRESVAVLEIVIPDAAKSQMNISHTDMVDRNLVTFAGDIKPEWIKAAWMVATGPGGARSRVKVLESGGSIFVAVVLSRLKALQHDYSSTQVNLPEALADKVLAYGQTIPDADLAVDGREDEIHATVKYGLHTTSADKVRPVLEGFGAVSLALGKTACFEGEEYDVLYVSVDSPDLVELNKRISEALPVTDTHPTYTPHICVAYLKPGLGANYTGDKRFVGESTTIEKVLFSPSKGRDSQIRMAGGVYGHPFYGNQWDEGLDTTGSSFSSHEADRTSHAILGGKKVDAAILLRLSDWHLQKLVGVFRYKLQHHMANQESNGHQLALVERELRNRSISVRAAGDVEGHPFYGNQWTDAAAHVEELVTGWSEGEYDWSEMQHAARAVIEGQPQKDYACADCKGSDKERYENAKLLLETIEKTEPLDMPLYRGLKVDPTAFVAGAEFSESLTSWTAREDLATQFAKGEYGGKLGHAGSSVVLVFEASQAKGLPVHSGKPLIKDAKEYLTTGKYRVTSVETRDGVTYAKVTRTGPAESVQKKWDWTNAYGKVVPQSRRIQPVV